MESLPRLLDGADGHLGFLQIDLSVFLSERQGHIYTWPRTRPDRRTKGKRVVRDLKLRM